MGHRPLHPNTVPSQLLLDQVTDKWALLVLDVLCDGPLRFNALRRALDGITQKTLTQCLRRMERNGILSRRVVASSPVAVEYSITPLGRTLEAPFQALATWTVQHLPEVEKARQVFDERASESP